MRVVGVLKPAGPLLFEAKLRQVFRYSRSIDPGHDKVKVSGFPLVVSVDRGNAATAQHSYYPG